MIGEKVLCVSNRQILQTVTYIIALKIKDLMIKSKVIINSCFKKLYVV